MPARRRGLQPPAGRRRAEHVNAAARRPDRRHQRLVPCRKRIVRHDPVHLLGSRAAGRRRQRNAAQMIVVPVRKNDERFRREAEPNVRRRRMALRLQRHAQIEIERRKHAVPNHPMKVPPAYPAQQRIGIRLPDVVDAQIRRAHIAHERLQARARQRRAARQRAERRQPGRMRGRRERGEAANPQPLVGDAAMEQAEHRPRPRVGFAQHRQFIPAPAKRRQDFAVGVVRHCFSRQTEALAPFACVERHAHLEHIQRRRAERVVRVAAPRGGEPALPRGAHAVRTPEIEQRIVGARLIVEPVGVDQIEAQRRPPIGRVRVRQVEIVEPCICPRRNRYVLPFALRAKEWIHRMPRFSCSCVVLSARGNARDAISILPPIFLRHFPRHAAPCDESMQLRRAARGSSMSERGCFENRDDLDGQAGRKARPIFTVSRLRGFDAARRRILVTSVDADSHDLYRARRQPTMETRSIAYDCGGARLTGYFADDAPNTKKPAVLIAHEAFGLNEHIRARARRLAELGYAAFALDMYGAEGFPMPEAMRRHIELMSTPGLMHARASAALSVLMEQPGVDRERVAAIGFCQGGISALELARGGAPIRCAVGFHPGLMRPAGSQDGPIRAKVLMMIGARDPDVPAADQAAFAAEMQEKQVDWQLHLFGGVGHAYTNPDADGWNKPGYGYSRAADQRAWTMMLALFDEVFGGAAAVGKA